MRLEQLQQVVEINRCHSVSQAAKKLFMTQPSLSRSVSKLEEELNVTIFKRSVSGVEQTEQGKQVLEQAEHILNEIEMLHNIAQINPIIQGNVHLAVTPIFYNTVMTELILWFKSHYPNVNLVMMEKSTLGVMEAINKGKCDLGITGCQLGRKAATLDLFESNHLSHSPFIEVGFSMFVNSKDPLAQKEQITLEEIQNLKLVEYEGNWESVFKKAGCPLTKKPLVVYDRETQKRIVAQGGWVTLMPEFFGMKDIYMEQKILSAVPIRGNSEILRSMVCFIHNDEAPLTLLEQEVVRMIKVIYEQLQKGG